MADLSSGNQTLWPARPEIISALAGRSDVDVLVCGGGIHGAVFGRLAALNGLRTVLLESDDYANATSSRSSKMAHGGLRYLEYFDLRQVFEGIRAREALFQAAPHIVRPQRFLIPLQHGEWWHRCKLRAGLSFYDLCHRSGSRRHFWINAAEEPLTAHCANPAAIAGFLGYYDGLMHDTRLVLENILSMRQEGGVALNYARLDSYRQAANGRVQAHWTDMRTGRKYELETAIIVNCTGPWAPWLGRLSAGELRSRVRYSRGVHLLFSKPWPHPALLMRLPERGRYYFVWPHAGGTMVGTTEKEVSEPERDPLPSEPEVAELLESIARDLPGAGLTRECLYYGFAGLRTLAVRKRRGSTAAESRRHEWVFKGGVLHLLGGKFTTAAWTALEGLRQVFTLARLSSWPRDFHDRLLPGAGLLAQSTEHFQAEVQKRGLPPAVAASVIGRLGSRVRLLLDDPEGLEPLGDSHLRGEVKLALAQEQAENLTDLMRRRLDLEFLPGHGQESLATISDMLQKARPENDVPNERRQYQERVTLVRSKLGLS